MKRKGSTIRITTDKRGRTKSISVHGPFANTFFHGMAEAAERISKEKQAEKEKKDAEGTE